MRATKVAALMIPGVALAALTNSHAGVVAEETIVMDFLQMLEINTQVITSIEGDKARLDLTLRLNDGHASAADDPGIHTTDIHRLDRGVVYNWTEPSREYRESKLTSRAEAMDLSRRMAALASDLDCQWMAAKVVKSKLGSEVVGGVAASHVRIDASHRCASTAPAGPSCALGIAYDQWSITPNELHARLARYRRDYAAKAGSATGIAEEFTLFSQFGVPVDPVLLESIRKAVASEGQPLKSHAALSASRACFAYTQPAQSDSPSLFQYVGGMLLHTWIAELDERPGKGGDDQAETLGTIATELKSIHAENLPESTFELPAGFTKAL